MVIKKEKKKKNWNWWGSGQAKKLTAKNEREATEADLLAEKMQVDAANAAEEAKSTIQKSA